MDDSQDFGQYSHCRGSRSQGFYVFVRVFRWHGKLVILDAATGFLVNTFFVGPSAHVFIEGSLLELQ